MVEIWLAFTVGLVGSSHCLGMCGGVVSALAIARRHSSAGERLFFNVLYQSGRISTYCLLGVCAGLASQAGMVETLKPAMRWLFLAANLFVTAIGLCTAIGVRSFGISALDGSGWDVMRRLLSRLSVHDSVVAAIPAGLLMGLMPCGLVYGVLISAATSGSPLKGGGMMLAFGCGTLPVLLTYGQIAATLSALGRGIFQRGMGFVVALLGLAGVWKVLAG